MIKTDDFLPSLTWKQLESVLDSLADTPGKKAMVRHLTAGTRKQAPFLTPEGNLKEIIYIGAVLLDARFNPSVSDVNTLDASSRSSPSRQSSPW